MKIPVLLAFLSAQAIMAQTPGWTLKECIDHALKNNPDIQLARLNENLAHNTFSQSKLNRTPDFSATGGQFFQSGRSIDRFSNQFVQTTVRSNNIQLQGSMLVYSGGQINNTINQNKYLWIASEYDLKNIEQNVLLNISNLYLQALLSKELTAVSEQTVLNTKLQIDRAEKLFRAGSANEGQLLNLKAQLASDELTLINNKNQELNALSNLRMALRIPYTETFDIAKPVLPESISEVYPESLETIIDSAFQRRPELKAGMLRIKAAQYAARTSRGQLYPTISVGGNLSTVYSSNAKTPSNPVISGFQPIGRVQGSNEVVEAPQISYTLQTIAFSKQVKDNFGQSLGVNLNIPIYSQLQGRFSIQRGDIETERAKLNLERARLSAYNEIQTAWNAFQSASARFEAAKKNAEAQTLNLSYLQKRFDAGMSGLVDLQLAQSLESSARLNITSAKYEILFRKLVLDFYMGKELKL